MYGSGEGFDAVPTTALARDADRAEAHHRPEAHRDYDARIPPPPPETTKYRSSLFLSPNRTRATALGLQVTAMQIAYSK